MLQDFEGLANCLEFLQVRRVLTRNVLKKEREEREKEKKRQKGDRRGGRKDRERRGKE